MQGFMNGFSFRHAGRFLIGAVLLCVGAGIAFDRIAFGQSSPSATGFTGNPWAQVGQHMTAGGNPPVLTGTNCGQAGATTGVVAGSTDIAGTIVNGSATSGCVLTFFQPWNVAPFCNIIDRSTPADSAGVVVSRLAITFGTIAANDVLTWICIGQAGG